MNGEVTGDFIAEVRKQKNMTQRDLAEKIGVSDKTISKWETGKSIPDLSCIDALCVALEVSVNEILSGQHLSESDYTQKAEETIMSLISFIIGTSSNWDGIDFKEENLFGNPEAC